VKTVSVGARYSRESRFADSFLCPLISAVNDTPFAVSLFGVAALDIGPCGRAGRIPVSAPPAATSLPRTDGLFSQTALFVARIRQLVSDNWRRELGTLLTNVNGNFIIFAFALSI
jgi:hypothetical protein